MSTGEQTLQRLADQGTSRASFASRFDAAVSLCLPILLVVLVAVAAGLLATVVAQHSRESVKRRLESVRRDAEAREMRGARW